MMINSQKALDLLKEGNRRYVGGRSGVPADLSLERDGLVGGQSPYAAVVCCADSRVPPEIIFDAGLGHILVVRSAGHAADGVVLGSVELAAEITQLPLVVVMGHTECATLAVAASGKKLGSHMAAVMAGVKPDVDENIRHTVEKLEQSPVLAQMASEGRLKIVGAKYEMESGMVHFWD